MKNTKKRGSVQELLDAETFTKYGLLTGNGELVFFSVAPTNVAVLSRENVEQKIMRLKNLLFALPNIEFICSDSCECFDANIAYAAQRAAEETNPMVRRMLEKDKDFFSSAQTESSTARQFIFIVRFPKQKKDTQMNAVSSVLQTISSQNFDVRVLDKPQIKRFLAIYLGDCTDGDRLPDHDGDQYREVLTDEE